MIKTRGGNLASSTEQNAWVLSLRGAKNPVDPSRPYAFFLEEERTEQGEMASVATIFLTNRECPWRCLMCDLWRNTLDHPAPPGAIVQQIDYALANLGPATQIKLYNAGSFFDPHAIPRQDYQPIAERLGSYQRIIVESHPSLVGADCLSFHDLLDNELEVAMGLETVDPEILPKLNKRMTLDTFAKAAEFLATHGIGLRAFILVKPPFSRSEEVAVHWAVQSAALAFACGATAVSLIPTRSGNGAMDLLAQRGDFCPPRFSTIEDAMAEVLKLGRGRVFVDLWDLEKFSDCSHCFPARRERLEGMNRTQLNLPSVPCPLCSKP